MWANVLRALRAHRALALSILTLSLAGGGFTVALVVDSDGPGSAPAVTYTVNARLGDGAPARTLTVPAEAVEEAERATESQLADTDVPVAVPTEDLAAAAEAQEEIRKRAPPLPTAGASQGFAGCRTAFQSTNFSSRAGVRPIAQIVHYTASFRVPNSWADVLGVAAFLARPSTRASAHFIIDDEGHCLYTVPIEFKAWTAVAGNPFGVQYEIVARGNEAQFMTTAGWARLRSVMRQVSQRTGIPLRRGAVVGCTVVRSGIVQHRDGGICWGGHHDITPFSIDDVVRRVSMPVTPLTKVEHRIVRGISVPKGTGHSRRYWCQRNHQQRALLRRLAHNTTTGWSRSRGQRYQVLRAAYQTACRR
jgi:N-acetylmuramoyl-L-alanine amidase